MKRRIGQQPPRGNGYGNQGVGYGGGNGGGTGGIKAGSHPSQMSIQDKIATTCKDW